MLYLQCKDDYQKIVRLNIMTNEANVIDRNDLHKSQVFKCSGVYSCVEEHKVFFYRYEGKLFLKIDNNIWHIEDNITSTWIIKAEEKIFKAVFALYESWERIFSLEYKPFGSRDIIPCDDTAFVDEEDYDFLIFVNNVLNSKERRSIIYLDAF